MSEETKGKNKYKFAVGSKNKFQVSNLAHLEVIVCGKEILKFTKGNDDSIDYIFEKDETSQKPILQAELEKWFQWSEGDEDNSSPECGITEYGLYSVPVGGKMLDKISETVWYGNGKLWVKNTGKEGKQPFYFEAKTKGGVFLRRSINIYMASDNLVFYKRLEA